jgi:hypothetical protein
MKSRRIRWAGHVARMGEVKNAYKMFNGKLNGRDHKEDLSVDGKIILEWILGKLGRKV